MLYIYPALSGKYLSDILFHSSIFSILDNERNNIIFQAFLEHNQAPHTTIAILKWMDTFKLHMKIQNIIKSLFFLATFFSSYLQLLPEVQSPYRRLH